MSGETKEESDGPSEEERSSSPSSSERSSSPSSPEWSSSNRRFGERNTVSFPPEEVDPQNVLVDTQMERDAHLLTIFQGEEDLKNMEKKRKRKKKRHAVAIKTLQEELQRCKTRKKRSRYTKEIVLVKKEKAKAEYWFNMHGKVLKREDAYVASAVNSAVKELRTNYDACLKAKEEMRADIELIKRHFGANGWPVPDWVPTKYPNMQGGRKKRRKTIKKRRKHRVKSRKKKPRY